MLVDALAHLSDPRVSSLDAVLSRAKAAGVGAIVSAGTAPLAEQPLQSTAPPGLVIKRAFGIHPAMADSAPLPLQLEALQQHLEDEQVVALGEMGIDRRAKMPTIDVQLSAFRAQLSLARERELPIILHGVRAVGLLLEELSSFGRLEAGGLWHGFSGPADILPKLSKLNLSVSFGALVTNPQATRCHQAAAAVELSRLLIESDCPDHPTPQSQSGIGEPSQLPELIAELAALRGVPETVIAEATATNASRLFGLGDLKPH